MNSREGGYHENVRKGSESCEWRKPDSTNVDESSSRSSARNHKTGLSLLLLTRSGWHSGRVVLLQMSVHSDELIETQFHLMYFWKYSNVINAYRNYRESMRISRISDIQRYRL